MRPYTATAGPPLELTGDWHVEFLKGGPELPPPARMATLASWTELGGEAQRFAGVRRRYRLDFDLTTLVRNAASAANGATNGETASPEMWALDLGDVRESARVRINGEEVTTSWSVPFIVRLGTRVKPGRNVLELDVTNLAANRIRDMDRRGVKWKIMREINFVDINYRPFDASKWDLKPQACSGPCGSYRSGHCGRDESLSGSIGLTTLHDRSVTMECGDPHRHVGLELRPLDRASSIPKGFRLNAGWTRTSRASAPSSSTPATTAGPRTRRSRRGGAGCLRISC